MKHVCAFSTNLYISLDMSVEIIFCISIHIKRTLQDIFLAKYGKIEIVKRDFDRL